MSIMFYNCNNLTNIDLSNFYINSNTNTSDMLPSSESLETIEINEQCYEKINIQQINQETQIIVL